MQRKTTRRPRFASRVTSRLSVSVRLRVGLCRLHAHRVVLFARLGGEDERAHDDNAVPMVSLSPCACPSWQCVLTHACTPRRRLCIYSAWTVQFTVL